jgi:hypothetical protein
MLSHQFSAFAEGLFGPLHSEFERTPKAASVTVNSRNTASGNGSAGIAAMDASSSPPVIARKPYSVKIRWPYVLAEAFLVVYQLAWTVLFASSGLVLCAIGAGYIAGCVIYLGFFYADHAGKVCFILDGSRIRQARRRSLGPRQARTLLGRSRSVS